MKSHFAALILIASFGGPAAFAQSDDRPPPHRREMDEATRAAFDACKDKLPPRESGTRPTREQFEAFRACMKENGATPPPRGEGRHHRRHHGQNGQGDQQATPEAPQEQDALHEQ